MTDCAVGMRGDATTLHMFTLLCDRLSDAARRARAKRVDAGSDQQLADPDERVARGVQRVVPRADAQRHVVLHHLPHSDPYRRFVSVSERLGPSG